MGGIYDRPSASPVSGDFAFPSHRGKDLLLIAKNCRKLRLTRKFYLTQKTQKAQKLFLLNTDGTDGTDGGYCDAISFSQYFHLFACFRNPKLSVGSGQSVVFSHHTDGTFLYLTQKAQKAQKLFISRTRMVRMARMEDIAAAISFL